MRNFPTDLDEMGVSSRVVSGVSITERRRPAPKSHLASSHEDWTWEQLRDYLKANISVEGYEPFKVASIVKGFMARWGGQAVAIAKYLIEDEEGVWAGHPVTITSFCKGSDLYVASPVSERLG